MIERELELSGVRIGYREASGSGTTIVFCHGNSASSEVFEPLVRRLGGTVHGLALDWYGHGRSSLPESNICSVQGCARLLIEFVEARVPGPFVLVGHSLGGHVAMEALPHLGDRMRGLLSIAAPPFRRETIAQVFRDPVEGLLFRDELAPRDAERVADALFERSNVSDDQYRAAARRLLETARGVRSGIGSSIAGGAFADELEACRGSHAPLSFVQGRLDPFIDCAYYEGLPRLLQCELQLHLLEGVGHSPHIEAERQVASAIDELVGR